MFPKNRNHKQKKDGHCRGVNITGDRKRSQKRIKTGVASVRRRQRVELVCDSNVVRDKGEFRRQKLLEEEKILVVKRVSTMAFT